MADGPLEQRYLVQRIRCAPDGTKSLEPAESGVFLKFSDPIARKGIQARARALKYAGYLELAADIEAKLEFSEVRDGK